MMAAFSWRQFQRLAWVAYLSPISFVSTASSSWIPENYEAFFSTPWEEGTTEGFQHLEHIFVAIPAHAPSKQVFYDLLGFAPDARRLHNLNKGSGTIWANIGISQIHLPVGDPQVVPGTIGLVYNDLTEVISRLKENKHEALDGTKFAWQERSDGALEVTCPYGNVLRLHGRRAAMQNGPGTSTTSTFDYRGGRLPSESSSLGLGIAYAHFRVRPGTAAGLARFYREVLGAETVETVDGQSANQPTCSMTGFDEGERRTKAGAIVRVGPIQYLAFVESEEALPEYDGHHMCLYTTEEGFRRSFLEAERRGLVFINPRPGFGNADTLEKALDEKQFRVKNMVDPSTGEVLHELEHEIRSISHPSYPVGKNMSI